jgi:putative CocE/NonD family hydrolase
LKPGLAVARRWLGLPRPRARTEQAAQWIACDDGTQLATTLVQPRGLREPAPCVLVRTERELPGLLGVLLAERGFCVVLQTCRGRGDSEGEFVPFVHESADAGATVDWIAGQPWFDGRLAAIGLGYGGHTAWAAASARPRLVRHLVSAFACRDPYRALYAGGALQLEWALHFGLRMVSDGDALDLLRAVRHRPLREADRIALRRTDWFREWLEHPTRDAFWTGRTPSLPDPAPSALLLTGAYHPTLGGVLADQAELAGVGAPPDLIAGPWGVGGSVRNEPRVERVVPRRIASYLESAFADAPARRPIVRAYVSGSRCWREGATWPLECAEQRTFALEPSGEDGPARLVDVRSASTASQPIEFVYDPADATPSRGGCQVGHPGPVDQSSIDARGDVVVYESEPMECSIELLGPVSLVLHAESDAEATDFAARLCWVDAAGHSLKLCEGIARRSDAAAGTRIDVDLEAAQARVAAGGRLRLVIASASFPRFDRHTNTGAAPSDALAPDTRPARQRLLHDAAHASELRVTIAR